MAGEALPAKCVASLEGTAFHLSTGNVNTCIFRILETAPLETLRLSLARNRANARATWLAYGEAFPARTHRFCGKEEGETNYAERWFGTVCSRPSRLARRAYPCSKRIERHLDAIRLFITTYNLEIIAK